MLGRRRASVARTAAPRLASNRAPPPTHTQRPRAHRSSTGRAAPEQGGLGLGPAELLRRAHVPQQRLRARPLRSRLRATRTGQGRRAREDDHADSHEDCHEDCHEVAGCDRRLTSTDARCTPRARVSLSRSPRHARFAGGMGHAYTHERTHARTHARTHTHTCTCQSRRGRPRVGEVLPDIACRDRIRVIHPSHSGSSQPLG